MISEFERPRVSVRWENFLIAYMLHFTTAAPISTHQNIIDFLAKNTFWCLYPAGKRRNPTFAWDAATHPSSFHGSFSQNIPFMRQLSLLFIVSSNRLERISATLSWNIGAHTFVKCYENNHVDRGGITAGLSQLADHQGQNSIETYTNNYYRRYTTKEHTNYQQLPKEGENGQS